jgi:uncharacterized protein YbjT (DUF2867 family)
MAASSACFSAARPAQALRPRARRGASPARAPRSRVVRASAGGVVPEGSRVLVVGATGGVGQLVVAKLLEAGYRVRAAARSAERAFETFGDTGADADDRLEIVSADLRDFDNLRRSNICAEVDAVVSCVGTTAFPSARWRDGNGPEQTDYVSVKNVVECVKTQSNTTCVRFVLVSSIGVERTNVMPFLVLNLFGVLKNKKRGEDFLIASGLNYTILRPGRLTDGPYTSYDINTLVKATSGERRAVEVEKGDSLLPEETSRIVVADAAVASLRLTSPANQSYCMGTKEGDGPKDDLGKWEAVFNEANGR